jgi:hypothetical protein
MHLVGYLCEDYHDARSLEHKVRLQYVVVDCSEMLLHIKSVTGNFCQF